MPYDPEQLPEKDKAQPTCSPGDDNELYILIAQCGSMTVEMQPIDALSFMAAVIKSFRNHFAHEEKILYHSKYRRTSDHVVQHWKFIQRLSALSKAYSRGNHNVISEFKNYVSEWLSEHISVADREFHEFLRDHPQRRG